MGTHMQSPSFLASFGRQAKADVVTSLSLAVVAAFFVASGIVSYLNIDSVRRNSADVTRTHDVLMTIEELFSLVQDAETGNRGYLVTGVESYLQPYTNALPQIDEKLTELDALTRDDAEQQGRMQAVKIRVKSRLQRLAESLAARRAEGFEAARLRVLGGHGKADMDALRATVISMQADERQKRRQRIAGR